MGSGAQVIGIGVEEAAGGVGPSAGDLLDSAGFGRGSAR